MNVVAVSYQACFICLFCTENYVCGMILNP